MADAYLARLDRNIFLDWSGGGTLNTDSAHRADYTAALRAANQHDFDPLVTLVRSIARYPITVFAVIEVPDADIGHVNGAVSELARQSILEAGCLRYNVYQSRKQPVRLIIQELWADDAAIERHRGSSQVKEFKTPLTGIGVQILAGQCGLLE